MNYGLIYNIPFASLRGEACAVEIEQEGYTGAAIELIASDSPFTVEIDDGDFLYTPSRLSTATVSVVGSDYLQSLFSTAYQQYRVTFKREGVATWCGFVKPEVYTQDYSTDKFELEIECMSALSTLEYIRYKSVEERKFVSLWALLQKCIQSANGQYNAVYLPHVYASSLAQYDAGENVLEKMTVSEQDFFDEDDEAMTLKEILEEICKLLNWTICDWRGELYFVDTDHEGQHYKYDHALVNKVGEVDSNMLNVQTTGFAGSGQTLDILPGGNKATVRVSNYSFDQVFPEEDYEELKEFTGIMEATVKDKVSVKQFFYPEVYKLYQYGYGLGSSFHVLSPNELDLYKKSPTLTANDIVGAMPAKRCDYKLVKGKPDITNYNWENMIQVGTYKDRDHQINGILILEFANPLPVAPYSDGAIVIGMSLQVTMNADMTVGYVKQSGWLDMRCALSIGDDYYNGKEWVKDATAAFDIEFLLKDYDGNSFINNVNTKTLSMPYDGAEGCVIELPRDRILIGAVNFRLYQLSENYKHNNTGGMDEVHGTANRGHGYFIKDLKMDYKLRDGVADDLKNSSDRFYENVVNEDYINKLDEIEFKISSYNNDGACYSKVMLFDKYLTNNLYASIVDEQIRPEELLIRRIVNRYDVTRIKLTQEIQETSDLTPLTRLSDNFMVNRIFTNAGGSIDYKMGQFRCVMIEI